MDVDPADGSLRFSFQAGRRRTDIDDTIERLLELPAELAVERKRRVVLVFDEFQEIVSLDKRFPNLMRSVFQTQPEVGHVYLGSKRQILERIFNDRNEPFWRSAKRLELGPIPGSSCLLRSSAARFADGSRAIGDEALDAAAWRHAAASRTPPRSSRYFLWELVAPGGRRVGREGRGGARQRDPLRVRTTSRSSGTERPGRSVS